ncbi:hypothetical protein QA648_17850 [Rhizobium sp. CB3171]|uniref:hypothetical protein n=1 Tax=Rhizobium sp. CB3171 TaxID=3039157 RepID=UPI0024B27919|nr:hypothetical protein [Rhizobium sp. CB3171]WFU01941.1 hypothetical protein QA648_17850 [Rhizobium sp. CB3171]
MRLARYGLACLLIATLPAAATPAAAMLMEQIPTIDPLGTSCAAYLKKTRLSSIGRFVLAMNLLPVTANSPVTGNPGEPSLYGDLAGLMVIPVDPPSYATIVTRKLPSWLFLSFDADPAAAGTLRRGLAFAAPRTCQAGKNQYVPLDAVPLDLKRQLLRALIDLRNGGTGDPTRLAWEDYSRIGKLAPASVDAELQNAVQSLPRN